MSVLFWLPAAVALVLTIAAAVHAVRRSRAITFDEERYPGLSALRRATLSSRHVGIAGGVAVFLAVGTTGRFGQGLFVAPAAAGAVVIAAILVGQRLTYTRARTAGSAGIERRQVGDYLPRRLATVAAALLLMLVAVAAWSTLAAAPDASGLARAFTHPCTTLLLDQQGSQEPTNRDSSTTRPSRCRCGGDRSPRGSWGATSGQCARQHHDEQGAGTHGGLLAGLNGVQTDASTLTKIGVKG